MKVRQLEQRCEEGGEGGGDLGEEAGGEYVVKFGYL